MSSQTPKVRRALRTMAASAGLCTALATGSALAQDRPKHLTLVGLPSGTVAPHGTVFGSLSLTNRRVVAGGAVRDNDGSLALGFGLGSAEDSVGVQVTMDIASLSRSFGDAGSFSLKASRRLTAGDWPVYASVSADYLGSWGAVRFRKPSYTVAVTTFGSIQAGAERYPVMFTLGAGDRVRNNFTRAGVFAGVGVGLTESLAVSAAWTGEAVDLGIGLRIPELEGLNFTLAVNDVTDRVNQRRVTASATWAVSNLFGR